MSLHIPAPPGQHNPLRTAVGTGGFAALFSALLVVLMEFGVSFSPNQVAALSGFVGILGPFLVAVTGNKAIAKAWSAGINTDPGQMPTATLMPPPPPVATAESEAAIAEKLAKHRDTTPPKP